MAAILLACVGVAVVLHSRGTTKYKATSEVQFAVSSAAGTALQTNQAGGADPERDAGTVVLVARSLKVAQAVRSDLGLRDSAADLQSAITAEAAPNANVLKISAKSTDPTQAAELANSFAKNYILFEQNQQIKGITDAEKQLKKELAAGRVRPSAPPSPYSLASLADARAGISTSNRIIGSADVPSVPTGLRLSIIVALALIIGLAIALTALFILESLDRRVGSIDEFEALYRLPALASIPQGSFRHRKADERARGLEPYRIRAAPWTSPRSAARCRPCW